MTTTRQGIVSERGSSCTVTTSLNKRCSKCLRSQKVCFPVFAASVTWLEGSWFLVARIVHFLKLRVVGKRIKTASAIDDANVFGKVGTSGAEVETALKGKKVREPRTNFLRFD